MNIEIEVLNEILTHRAEVQKNLAIIRAELEQRGIMHDISKFEDVEFDAFVTTRPKFKKANYGSKEYKECEEQIKPALDHHYSTNRHHIKYHPHGFEDMNLLDILEMLADWKAASKRSPNLSFKDSLKIAFKKYEIPKNMQRHIIKTLEYLNWL